MSSQPRSTTTRDKHRRMIKRDQPACGICLESIDYSLPYLDPMEFVVDHIVPLSKGGYDTIDNKQAAHRTCNRDKSDDMATPIRTYETHRQW